MVGPDPVKRNQLARKSLQPTPDPAPPNAPSSLRVPPVDRANLQTERGALVYRALKRQSMGKGGSKTAARIKSSGLTKSQIADYLASMKP